MCAPLRSRRRHCRCLAFPLPSQRRHRHCLVCFHCLRSEDTAIALRVPLPSQLRHRLSLRSSGRYCDRPGKPTGRHTGLDGCAGDRMIMAGQLHSALWPTVLQLICGDSCAATRTHSCGAVAHVPVSSFGNGLVAAVAVRWRALAGTGRYGIRHQLGWRDEGACPAQGARRRGPMALSWRW